MYYLCYVHKLIITISLEHLNNTGYLSKCVKITEQENGSNTDMFCVLITPTVIKDLV